MYKVTRNVSTLVTILKVLPTNSHVRFAAIFNCHMISSIIIHAGHMGHSNFIHEFVNPSYKKILLLYDHEVEVEAV